MRRQYGNEKENLDSAAGLFPFIRGRGTTTTNYESTPPHYESTPPDREHREFYKAVGTERPVDYGRGAIPNGNTTNCHDEKVPSGWYLFITI